MTKVHLTMHVSGIPLNLTYSFLQNTESFSASPEETQGAAAKDSSGKSEVMDQFEFYPAVKTCLWHYQNSEDTWVSQNCMMPGI